MLVVLAQNGNCDEDVGQIPQSGDILVLCSFTSEAMDMKSQRGTYPEILMIQSKSVD